MNLKQIRYALAVAEEQSFTRAAQRCHTVQSALSHQVAKLEEELGCTLFERTSRRVELTTAGRAFIQPAQRLLAAKQTLGGGSGGGRWYGIRYVNDWHHFNHQRD
ncbi:Ben and cat operon transcriptional regulator [Serratia fonticola]|uniref:Ben and cat operon transcriptional regulator n=1 Tax=Serratia fonticola TaxID=47917 RepID=A0A4U9TXN9_SERFO|nr:Ben and cat operon transcriptional regulator [Serratia fonticola]